MIRFLVMDVDGTLTDGKIYMGAAGEAFKAFDIKDGYAIKEQMPSCGIIPVIITARTSEMLRRRCDELGITELHQGCRDKMQCLSDILARYGATLADVAYIGDDILDLQCIGPVAAAGGLAGCPANAAPQVIAASNFVAPHNGGDGAVRDFLEYIISLRTAPQTSLRERIAAAVDFIDRLDAESLSPGRHNVAPDFYFNVIEYVPSPDCEVLFESHRHHVDIQRIVSGEEFLRTADVALLTPHSSYNSADDVVLYADHPSASGVLLRPSSSVVLMPNNAHKATAYGTSGTQKVKKIVGKLTI